MAFDDVSRGFLWRKLFCTDNITGIEVERARGKAAGRFTRAVRQ